MKLSFASVKNSKKGSDMIIQYKGKVPKTIYAHKHHI